jgi:hypothetical protein
MVECGVASTQHSAVAVGTSRTKKHGVALYKHIRDAEHGATPHQQGPDQHRFPEMVFRGGYAEADCDLSKVGLVHRDQAQDVQDDLGYVCERPRERHPHVSCTDRGVRASKTFLCYS